MPPYHARRTVIVTGAEPRAGHLLAFSQTNAIGGCSRNQTWLEW
jgi:hypothetical protein